MMRKMAEFARGKITKFLVVLSLLCCMCADEGSDTALPTQPPANTPAGAARLLSPDSLATGISTTPVLLWSPGHDADDDTVRYRVGITLFSVDEWHWSPWILDTAYHVSGLLPNTEYLWVVYSQDTHGSGRASAYWSFRTSDSP